MPTVTFIGDIHGNLRKFTKACENMVNVIQVGDFGFESTYKEFNQLPESENVKVLAGNHDDFSSLRNYTFGLGNFGEIYGWAYLRGAYSIDRQHRFEGIDWFPDEELSFEEGNAFLDWWESEKPELFFSHASSVEGLYCVVDRLLAGPSFTERLISEAFKIHSPKIHIHGHLHVSKSYKVGNTECRSLGINEVFSTVR